MESNLENLGKTYSIIDYMSPTIEHVISDCELSNSFHRSPNSDIHCFIDFLVAFSSPSKFSPVSQQPIHNFL